MKSREMKYIFIFFFAFHWLGAQELAKGVDFQLAPPQLYVDSLFFATSALLDMKFEFSGAEIYYTLDGSEVTLASSKYETPIIVTQSSHIKARSFHPDFQASKSQELQVTQVKKDLGKAEIRMSPQPHANYAGMGTLNLKDVTKGSFNFRAGNSWLGFQAKTVTFTLKFDSTTKISKIRLSNLIDQGNWIFSPKKVLIFSDSKQIGQVELTKAQTMQKKQFQFIEILLAPKTYKNIQIVVYSLDDIPDWHPGTGVPWFFIDEILAE